MKYTFDNMEDGQDPRELVKAIYQKTSIFHQPINLTSTNQPINQSTNQPINQSTYQPNTTLKWR